MLLIGILIGICIPIAGLFLIGYGVDKGWWAP